MMGACERSIKAVRECYECGARLRFYRQGRKAYIVGNGTMIVLYCSACGYERKELVTALSHAYPGRQARDQMI